MKEAYDMLSEKSLSKAIRVCARRRLDTLLIEEAQMDFNQNEQAKYKDRVGITLTTTLIYLTRVFRVFLILMTIMHFVGLLWYMLAETL